MKACLDCKVLFAEDHDECPSFEPDARRERGYVG